MRFILRPVANPRTDARTWFILAGVAALWAAARIIVPTEAGADLPGFGLPACPLRSWTGIPCPFCGITTGCAWLARGAWKNALENSLLSPILMIGSLVSAVYALGFRLVLGRELLIGWERGSRRLLAIFYAGLLAASWIFNLLRK